MADFPRITATVDVDPDVRLDHHVSVPDEGEPIVNLTIGCYFAGAVTLRIPRSQIGRLTAALIDADREAYVCAAMQEQPA